MSDPDISCVKDQEAPSVPRVLNGLFKDQGKGDKHHRNVMISLWLLLCVNGA